ncbi:MAG: hypothetical protein WC421_09260 [Elusimicrobiales bacterium]
MALKNRLAVMAIAICSPAFALAGGINDDDARAAVPAAAKAAFDNHSYKAEMPDYELLAKYQASHYSAKAPGGLAAARAKSGATANLTAAYGGSSGAAARKPAGAYRGMSAASSKFTTAQAVPSPAVAPQAAKGRLSSIAGKVKRGASAVNRAVMFMGSNPMITLGVGILAGGAMVGSMGAITGGLTFAAMGYGMKKIGEWYWKNAADPQAGVPVEGMQDAINSSRKNAAK